MEARARGMRAARTLSLTPPRIGTCSLDDHRPQLLRATAQRGVDAQVSWGWLFKGAGIENCTGGIEGLLRCAGATGGGTARLLWAQRRRSSRRGHRSARRRLGLRQRLKLRQRALTDAYLDYNFTHTVILVADGEVVRGR